MRGAIADLRGTGALLEAARYYDALVYHAPNVVLRQGPVGSDWRRSLRPRTWRRCDAQHEE